MPKINAYSRDNVFNTLGFIDLHISYLNQPVLDTSSPTFQNVNVFDDIVIGGDLFVSGNATISGNTTVIATDIVEIKDNIVLINSTETSPGVTLNLAGVEVERGTLPNFQSVFEESSDLYKIGEVGNLQTVATREDSPLDKGIIVYNQSLRRLDSVTTIELPVTFSDTTVSTSSSSGAIEVAGSIAISNTTNSSSFTVGGTFTTAGGIAVAKDTYIGGALDVTGTISAGISVPSITVSNIVNIVTTPSVVGIKLFSNGNQRELTITFRMTTNSVGLLSSFEFTVPDITTFSNVYDIVPVINAYSNDSEPVNIENTVGFCVVSTNRAKIKFTSGTNSTTTVQVIVKYNV